MDIDEQIQERLDTLILECLKKGQIHTIPYRDDMLYATLDMHKDELFRVTSNRGATHLLLLLAAAVLNNTTIEEFADTQFPYPVGPMSLEQRNILHQFAKQGCLSIYLTKDILHVDQCLTTMQSMDASTRPEYRTAHGTNLSEVLERLQEQPFTVVTCIPTKIQ